MIIAGRNRHLDRKGTKLNIILTLVGLLVPSGLAIKIHNKTLAIVLGTLWVWGVLVASSLYQQWSDPEKNQLPPAIAMVMGWFPGLVYSSICVMLITLCLHFLAFIKARRKS